ncbi:hypothetical protein GGR55DRAFT_643089 [Xylaria sp. FL0064]|nr:hypothetical protein GGR55DRAFT_643089 [Xylaria sp. FL0064]
MAIDANKWLKYCLPFEVPVPRYVDSQAVLASPDGDEELIFEQRGSSSRCERCELRREGVGRWETESSGTNFRSHSEGEET